MTVGVLSLQGAFSLHHDMLRLNNVTSLSVRDPDELMKCDGLIIPGGESSVLSKLIMKNNLIDAIKAFSESKPVFGTCAGMIIMSKNTNDKKVCSLNLIDIDVNRNAWGRQIDSFNTNLTIFDYSFNAIFIRAPKINSIGDSVKVLSEYKGNPVLVSSGIHLASSFHPELTNDPFVHNLFIDNILHSYESA